MNNIALEGVTIIDMTRVLSGPYCCQLLADMGARVIKIEAFPNGDDSRQFPPFVNGFSGYYTAVNRNKESVRLNLKTQEGKKVLKELIEKADILIENFRPGVMDRLGFSYEKVSEINPRIVFTSISGFGQTGPYSERPAYDIITQAMGGLMELNALPGEVPVKTGAYTGDMIGGMLGALGTMAAYSGSLITGRGQHVDVSLVDSVVSFMCLRHDWYLYANEMPVRLGNDDDGSAPYGCFSCTDGDVVIACSNDRLFERLTNAMKRPDLFSDERFYTNRVRAANRKQTNAIVQEWIGNMTVDEAIQVLFDHEIPSAPIMNIAKLANDPHIAGVREMFPVLNQPGVGEVRVTGSPIKMSDTPMDVRMHAPGLGEHTDLVLSELLGYSDSEIQRLRDKKVV